MRIKPVYKVRNIAGENIVVGQGHFNSDMTKMISFNSTAVLLWERLFGNDFSREDAAAVLVDEFHIPHDKAMVDANKWIDSLVKCGVIEV